MIRNLGAVAGLRFDEKAADAIALFCSDMPFWIRKACSYLHLQIEVSRRPIELSHSEVTSILHDFLRDEGAALAHVALRHLFRVYPEMKQASLRLLSRDKSLSAGTKRLLCRYGIATEKGNISGPMIDLALRNIEEEDVETAPMIDVVDAAKIADPLSEWAEELATISVRRNTLERTLRSVVVNFLRFKALSIKDRNAKDLLMEALPV